MELQYLFQAISFSTIIKALNQPLVAAIPPTIALYLSYIQIKEIRRTEKKQGEEVAVDNAIKYVNRFSKGVLPHFQEYKALKKNGVLWFTEIPNNGFKTFEPIRVEVPQDMDKKEATGIYEQINELEIIAAAILKGQVDKTISKNLLGALYCEAVEVYYDLISYLRKDNKQHFKMTEQLYLDWREGYNTVQSSVNQKKVNKLLEKIKEEGL